MPMFSGKQRKPFSELFRGEYARILNSIRLFLASLASVRVNSRFTEFLIEKERFRHLSPLFLSLSLSPQLNASRDLRAVPLVIKKLAKSERSRSRRKVEIGNSRSAMPSETAFLGEERPASYLSSCLISKREHRKSQRH